ncbi:MAG: hypothetical protein ABI743_11350, partial [bacterium]
MRLFHRLAGPISMLGLLAGCSQSTMTTPQAAQDQRSQPESIVAPVAVEQAGTIQSVVGQWTLTVDPATLNATIEPVRASQDNDALYRLPIDAFLTNNALRLATVKDNGMSLDVTYVFTHPFKSSTVTNRAD